MNRNVNMKAVVALAVSFLLCLSSSVSYAIGGAMEKKAVEGFAGNPLGDYITQDGVHHPKYLICHASGQYPCEIDYLSDSYQNIFTGNWTLDSMDSYSPPINTVTNVLMWIGDVCSNNIGANTDCIVNDSSSNGVGGAHPHAIYGGVTKCSGLKHHYETITHGSE